MLSFRAVLKVGRKNACICQQTFLLCHRFMVYVCKWTDLGRNPMNLLSFCLCPDAFAIFSPYASAGQPEKKKASVRSSAHNNICEEAKHIDISPERSKHFPEMLTSFARNVCFFLGKCTVFNPKCPLLWLEKPPFCTEKSAAAFYFILSGRRRSQ
mgnify:FL=1